MREEAEKLTMKITRNNGRGGNQGFTLVEMIGVLAVIAVLASMLVPRVFQAINDSRVNSAALSYNAVKSAAMMYFAKYGRFGGPGGVAFGDIGSGNPNADPPVPAGIDHATSSAWDKLVLLPEGFLEKPYTSRLGDGGSVRLRACESRLTAIDGINAAYCLDGINTAQNSAVGQYVIEILIPNVSIEDAVALNDRIDGGDLGPMPAGLENPDFRGRVKYGAPAAGVTDVLIYVAHK